MPVQTTYSAAPPAAFAGMLADDTDNDVMTVINADTVSIPFGICVAFKTSSPTSDKDVILPGAGAKLAGIVVHNHDFARSVTLLDLAGNSVTVGELDSTGLVAGAAMGILWRGAIWVKVQQAVVVGDRLFVCTATGTVFTAKGQIGNADESSNTIDATNIGRFTSSSAAGGFAKLQVDFSQKP